MALAKQKPHGRAFYESLGSPKYVLAPMVDQSEFAWRLLTRSFLPPDLRTSILAYSPMLHARLFADSPKYRACHFEPLKAPLAMASGGDLEHAKTMGEGDWYLDGNPKTDRPLFVQFCANDPDALLEAAKVVQPYCDAVDLNLGCPQGIAKRGHYGAFLQEDWNTIHKMISTLHKGLDIPVTAKMRILESRERTLDYAKMLLGAGASIITVHGRQRDQKGHNTGLADWSVLRYLRESLPAETVIFANGNILQHSDIQRCLEETKVDGVMSAEGNLYDPTIFATAPPAGEEGREYWRGQDGKGGFRMDAVLRRYMDIVHEYVLREDPPKRAPLFLPSDPPAPHTASGLTPAPIIESRPEISIAAPEDSSDDAQINGLASTIEREGPTPTRKRKREEMKQQARQKKNPAAAKAEKCNNPNLIATQAHCFHMLRALVGKHHNVRDALARCRAGDIDAYENVLTLTEAAVKEGLLAYEADPTEFLNMSESAADDQAVDATESSDAAVRRCRRPYWVCQPYIRPLPKEALVKGSMQLSKKDLKKLAEQEKAKAEKGDEETREAGLNAGGKVEAVDEGVRREMGDDNEVVPETAADVQIPKEGVVCG